MVEIKTRKYIDIAKFTSIIEYQLFKTCIRNKAFLLKKGKFITQPNLNQYNFLFGFNDFGAILRSSRSNNNVIKF